MKKNALTKISAIILTLILSLQVFTVAFAAAETGNYNVKAELGYYDGTTGEWVSVPSPVAGEKLKMRFYVGTDYYAGSGAIALVFDKSLMSIDGYANVTLNKKAAFVKNHIQDGQYNTPGNLMKAYYAKDLISKEESEQYSILLVILNTVAGCKSFIYDDSEWLCEIDVNIGDVSGKSLYFRMPSYTVMSMSNSSGQSSIVKCAEDALASSGKEANYWYSGTPGCDIPPFYIRSSAEEEAHEHSFNEEVVTPSTCIATGTKRNVCSCGYFTEESIPLSDHTPGDWTYVSDGLFTKECSVCHTQLDEAEAELAVNVSELNPENKASQQIEVTGIDDLEDLLTFESSDENVATVSDDGTVTGVNPGTATITVSLEGSDIKKEITVNVQPREFTISWTADGKTESSKIKEGEKIVKPRVPVKEGFDFNYWTPSVPEIMPGEDQSFTASFTPKHFTVDITVDGNVIGQTEYTYGDTELDLSAYPVPEKEGCTGEWDYTLTANGAEVKAVYTPITYYAEFIADGKTVASVPYTVETASIKAPDVPAKTGYTGSWGEITLPVGGVTINAAYTPNSHKVSWVVDGAAAETECDFGSVIEKPADPSKDGYNFNGWLPEVPAAMPDEDQTFTASFTPKHFTVDITVDGKVIGQTEYTYGDTELDLSAYPVPEKDGYTGEWDYTLTANGAEVKAVYTPITYYAEFIADGKTVAELPYTVESKSVNAPAVPAKAGYSGKWSSYTLDIGGITVTAEYTLAGSIKIKNAPGGVKTVNYGEKLKLTAVTSNLPEGAVIKWYVNNSFKSEGTTFTTDALKSKSEITVTAKVVSADGTVLLDADNNEMSASENVTANCRFFKKLVSFFKDLFRKDRTVTQ